MPGRDAYLDGLLAPRFNSRKGAGQPSFSGLVLVSNQGTATAPRRSQKMLQDQRHRECGRRFFAVFTGARSAAVESGFCAPNPAQMLAPQHRSGALWISNSDPFFEERDLT
jgi:hypothetical protein